MLNVLVICTGNSCRSIIGEALFNHLGRGRIKAYSAGSKPLGRLNAGAVALLLRHGISADGMFSKSWDVFADKPIDIAITVCDNAAGETCPVYLNAVTRAHWGLADPGHVKGTEEEIKQAFEATYRAVARRIEAMLALPLEQMAPADMMAKLNVIGQMDN